MENQPDPGYAQYPVPNPPQYQPPYPQMKPPRVKYQNFAMIIIIVGTILIGVGIIVLGMVPGDIYIKEGTTSYGGYSSEYYSGYIGGYYDGEYDSESYYGDYHDGYYPYDDSGDYLDGYDDGYDDGYYGNPNKMSSVDFEYHPDIKITSLQVGCILAGIGTMLNGVGVALKIKAHFTQAEYTHKR